MHRLYVAMKNGCDAQLCPCKVAFISLIEIPPFY